MISTYLNNKYRLLSSLFLFVFLASCAPPEEGSKAADNSSIETLEMRLKKEKAALEEAYKQIRLAEQKAKTFPQELDAANAALKKAQAQANLAQSKLQAAQSKFDKETKDIKIKEQEKALLEHKALKARLATAKQAQDIAIEQQQQTLEQIENLAEELAKAKQSNVDAQAAAAQRLKNMRSELQDADKKITKNKEALIQARENAHAAHDRADAAEIKKHQSAQALKLARAKNANAEANLQNSLRQLQAADQALKATKNKNTALKKNLQDAKNQHDQNLSQLKQTQDNLKKDLAKAKKDVENFDALRKAFDKKEKDFVAASKQLAQAQEQADKNAKRALRQMNDMLEALKLAQQKEKDTSGEAERLLAKTKDLESKLQAESQKNIQVAKNLADAHKDLRDAQEENKRINREKDQALADLNTTRDENIANKKALDNAVKSLQQRQDDNKNLTQQISDLNNQLLNAKGEVTQTKKDLAEAQNQLAQAETNIKASKKDKEEALDELKVARDEQSKTERALEKERNDLASTKNSLDEKLRSNTKLESAFERLKKDLDIVREEARKQQITATANQKALDVDLKAAQEDARKAKSNLAKAEQSLVDKGMQADSAQQKALADRAEGIKQKEARIAELEELSRKSQEGFEKTLQDSKKQEEALNKQLSDLKLQLTGLTQEIAKLKQDYSENVIGYGKLLDKNKAAENKSARAEEQFKDALTKSEALERTLRNTQSELANLIGLSSKKEALEKELEALKKKLVEQKEEGDKEQNNLTQRVSALEGNLKTAEAKTLEAETKLKEAQDRMQDALEKANAAEKARTLEEQKTLTEAQKSLQDKELRNKGLEEELKRLDEQLRTAQQVGSQDKDSLQLRIEGLEKNLQQKQDDNEKLSQNLSDLANQISSTNNEIGQVKRELADARDIQSKTEQDLEKERQSLAATKKSLDEKLSTNTQLEGAIEALKNELDNVKEEARKQAITATASQKVLDIDLKTAQEDAREAKNNLAKARQSLLDTEKQADRAMQKALTDAAEDIRQREAKITELIELSRVNKESFEKALQNIKKQEEDLNRQLTILQTQLGAAEAEIAQVRNNLQLSESQAQQTLQRALAAEQKSTLAEEQLKSAVAKSEALELKLQSTQSELGNLIGASSKKEALEKELEGLKKQLEEGKQRGDVEQKVLADAQKSLRDQELINKGLEAELDSLKELHRTAQQAGSEEKNSLGLRIEELEKKLTAAQLETTRADERMRQALAQTQQGREALRMETEQRIISQNLLKARLEKERSLQQEIQKLREEFRKSGVAHAPNQPIEDLKAKLLEAEKNAQAAQKDLTDMHEQQKQLTKALESQKRKAEAMQLNIAQYNNLIEILQKNKDGNFNKEIENLDAQGLLDKSDAILAGLTLVQYYEKELKEKGAEQAAQSVREIFLMRFKSSSLQKDDNYCSDEFLKLIKNTKGTLLYYGYIEAQDNSIYFNTNSAVSVIKQLINVCMNKDGYAQKYFDTLKKLVAPPADKLPLASVESVIQYLEGGKFKNAKGTIWDEDTVELKGSNWIVSSPLYSDANRIKLAPNHSENFLKAWSKPLREAEEFVDITTLAVPEGEFMKELKESLKELDGAEDVEGKAITVRILFGINQKPVQVVDLKQVINDLTKDLKKNSKLTIYVGTYGVLNPLGVSSWNHSKIVSADGKSMFTGGHNLYAAYWDAANPTHDLSLNIPGKLAFLGHQFAQRLWDYVKTSTWTSYNGDWYKFNTDGKKHIIEHQILPVTIPKVKPPQAVAPSAAGEKVVAVGRLGMVGENVSDDAIAKMMADAQVSLFISQQATLQLFFKTGFNKVVVESIIRALLRGVDVYILSSSTKEEYVGAGNTGYTGRHDREQTWAYLYDFALSLNLDPDKEKAKAFIAKAFFEHLQVLPTGNKLHEVPNHAKVVIADGRVAYVGSHNLYDDSHAEFGIIVGKFASEELVSDYFSPLWLASMQTGANLDTHISLPEYKIGDYVLIKRSPQQNDGASANWTLGEVVANNPQNFWVLLDFLREYDPETSRVRSIDNPQNIIRAPGKLNSGRKHAVDVTKADLDKSVLPKW